MAFEEEGDDKLISFVSKLANAGEEKKKKGIAYKKASPSSASSTSKKRIRRTDVVAPESEFATLGSGTKGLSVESLLQGKDALGLSSSDKVFQEASVEKPRAPTVVEQRVLRKSAYGERAQELDKWTQSIKVNRNAETLDLRDKSRVVKLSSASMVHKFTPTTDMEKEITRLLEGSGGVDEKSMLQQEEKEMEKSGLTEEQVKERQGELQKMRSLLFYEQQKRHRINKIKSKSYHRIRKRQNRRLEEQAAEEEGDVSDDEANAEKEEKAELKRMQERMSLKHKNTSKWAREQLQKGNTDSSTRQAIAEQLRLGSELLKKANQAESESESEDSETEESNAVKDAGLILFNTDPNNNPDSSGTKKSLFSTGDKNQPATKEKGILGMKFMQRAVDKQKAAARKEAEEMLQNLNNEELLEFSDASEKEDEEVEEDEEEEEDELKGKKQSRQGASVIGNSMEVGLLSKSNKVVKVDGVLDVAMPTSAKPVKAVVEPEVNPWLDAPTTSARKTKRKRKGEEPDSAAQVKDMNEATTEMLSSASLAEILPSNSNNSKTSNKKKNNKRSKTDPNDEDNTEGEQEKMTTTYTGHEPTQAELVARAFASPDFESDFLKEKQALEAEKNGEAEVKESDGWGSWAGAGAPVFPPPFKKDGANGKGGKGKGGGKGVDNKQFTTSTSSKAADKNSNSVNKRKDQNMPLVVISDKRIKKASKLKLEEVPYPFTSREQYERSLAVPVGKEWNAMRATRGFTRPKMITNAGEVIAPVKLAKKSKK